MKRIDLRLLIGLTLIVGGILGILQQLNWLPHAVNLFWSAVLLVCVLWLWVRVGRRQASGLERLLAFGLTGLILIILPWPGNLDAWKAAVFLLAWGAGCLAWYASRPAWWLMVGAGGFFSLAAESAARDVFALPTDGVIWLGMALTLAVLAWRSSGALRRWGWIASLILALIGALMMAGAAYLMPVALIAGGVLIIAGGVLPKK